MRKALAILTSILALFAPMAAYAQQGISYPPVAQSRADGMFVASQYGVSPLGRIAIGNTATGSQTITLASGQTTLPDGRVVMPYIVNGTFTVADANPETDTITAVSGCAIGAAPNTCQLTASFTSTHGQSAQIMSGSAGLYEAIADSYQSGGGTVVIDSFWKQLGGTNAMITAAPVFPTVAILDQRNGVTRNWNPTPTGLSLAAPTLPAVNITGQAACDATHQMCSDATVVGSASWGGTVYACWAYVDIFGNEGPCSATTNWTSVASKAIDLGIPAASPGAVGAVPYLSLSGGTYALAYQIPVTSTVCTVTTLETITPACAVANSTYGQSASTYGAGGLFTTGGAQITTYPVSTAELYPVLATTAQTITAQHPMTNSSVTYSYAPGSRVGVCGASSANMVQLAAAGGISGSSATTVPNPLVSWSIPANCFNYIGAEFRVSGKFTFTDGGDTSTHIIVAWDSNVTNTASVPTPLCDILDTATGAAAAQNATWTCTIRVLTTGASGTAMVNGYGSIKLAAGATTLVRDSTDKAVAASAAIDLATNARIAVMFEGIGATNNPGAQTLEATLEAVN